MGNNVCGLNDKKEGYNFESKIIVQKTYKNVLITIVQGDILEEQSDAIVNASHDPAESQISKREKNLKTKEKLSAKNKLVKVGDLIPLETSTNAINSNFIYHTKLPLYTTHSDLSKIYNSYLSCLDVATKSGLKVVSFTDLSTPNFTIPKQYNAEVMMRAFINFLNETETTIEILKFVSLDNSTLKMFNYELDKQFDEMRVPELVSSRILKFHDFINPPATDETCSMGEGSFAYFPRSEKQYQQSRGLTSESEDNFIRQKEEEDIQQPIQLLD